MARVIWAPQAYADLEAIREFAAREAPRYGQMLAEGNVGSVDRLVLFPRSGRMVPEIRDEAIREVLYRGFRIIYIVSGEEDEAEAEILTVIPSSMPFG